MLSARPDKNAGHCIGGLQVREEASGTTWECSKTHKPGAHVISSGARNLLLSTIQEAGKADSSSFLLGMTLFEHSQHVPDERVLA